MECSSTNVGRLPLDEFVSVVATIYQAHDKHRSIWDVWCHTLHHAAGIAQQIRVETADNKLYTEIADFSLWLFTAVLKLTGKIGESGDRSETPQESVIRIQSSCSDLIWHKYPNACPLCSASKIVGGITGAAAGGLNPCQCMEHRPGAESTDARRESLTAIRSYSNQVRGRKPTSIDAWQEMFSTIFAKNLASLSPTQIALHLMEELGEVSDAMIRMYSYKQREFVNGEPNWRQSNLEAQLADVFSWLFALVNKLDWLGQSLGEHKAPDLEMSSQVNAPVRLSQIIWKRYGSDELHSFWCQACKGTECSCSIILVPATRSMDELMKKLD